MAETDQFSPESGGGTFPFKVGEEDFGFNGGFTEGKFTGMIRGADGKDFAGIVEDLGNGRYRIEDWESGRMFEPPSEQMVLPAADVAPGLEDAAAVAAMEAAPVEQAAAAGPTPEEVAEDIERTRLGMELPPVEEEKRVVEEPAATEPIFQPSAPASELQPEPEAQPAALPPLTESARAVVSEMKSKVAIRELLDRRAGGKLLSAVEISRITGEDQARVEARLQELNQTAKDLLLKIHNKIAGRDLEGLRASGKLLDAVQIATIKTAEPISDEEYAELKKSGQQLQELSISIPEISKEVSGKSEEASSSPQDPLAEIRQKQADGKLLTQWELAQLRLADNSKSSLPESTLAPVEFVAAPVVEELDREPVVVELPAEVVLPPTLAEEAAVPEPMEEPVVGAVTGEVVVDAEEQVRAAAATPAGTTPAEPVEAPMPEAPRQPVQAEAAAETPEQRFERRKQGFAGALAELDRARGDTSGTEGEQIIRLAEAYNQVIGAAMELMEEGEAAKEVVKGFFAGALETPGGRKLTEIAVRSRLDEAGVTGAPAGEKKKKLEQAGLLGLLELLLELGMSFTDKTIGAVITEVQSATGGGK